MTHRERVCLRLTGAANVAEPSTRRLDKLLLTSQRMVGNRQRYRHVIAGFFKWIEVVNQGHMIYHSPDFRRSGSAADDPAALAEAKELGGKLGMLLIQP